MKMFKGMSKLVAASALALSAGAVQAAPINVGGVIWDPDAIAAFPGLVDFNANGSIFEDVAQNPGDIVSGRGKVERVNKATNNEVDFCPGCELTFTFSMELVGFTGTPTGIGGSINGDFVFKDLVIKMFVDDTPDYTGGDDGTAGDGVLFLEMKSDLLSGTGTNLGSGSDTGSGSALLNVTDGLAMSNFDTNGEAGGADMLLNSSFFDIQVPGTLGGTADLRGNSIPEPSSLLLLGLGFLGLGAARRRIKS